MTTKTLTTTSRRARSPIRDDDANDLTDREAAEEAVRRWGPSGRARLRAGAPHKAIARPGRLARYRYQVGNGKLGPACTILGQGNSWREAFGDARPRGATGRIQPW